VRGDGLDDGEALDDALAASFDGEARREAVLASLPPYDEPAVMEENNRLISEERRLESLRQVREDRRIQDLEFEALLLEEEEKRQEEVRMTHLVRNSKTTPTVTSGVRTGESDDEEETGGYEHRADGSSSSGCGIMVGGVSMTAVKGKLVASETEPVLDTVEEKQDEEEEREGYMNEYPAFALDFALCYGLQLTDINKSITEVALLGLSSVLARVRKSRSIPQPECEGMVREVLQKTLSSWAHPDYCFKMVMHTIKPQWFGRPELPEDLEYLRGLGGASDSDEGDYSEGSVSRSETPSTTEEDRIHSIGRTVRFEDEKGDVPDGVAQSRFLNQEAFGEGASEMKVAHELLPDPMAEGDRVREEAFNARFLQMDGEDIFPAMIAGLGPEVVPAQPYRLKVPALVIQLERQRIRNSMQPVPWKTRRQRRDIERAKFERGHRPSVKLVNGSVHFEMVPKLPAPPAPPFGVGPIAEDPRFQISYRTVYDINDLTKNRSIMTRVGVWIKDKLPFSHRETGYIVNDTDDPKALAEHNLKEGSQVDTWRFGLRQGNGTPYSTVRDESNSFVIAAGFKSCAQVPIFVEVFNYMLALTKEELVKMNYRGVVVIDPDSGRRMVRSSFIDCSKRLMYMMQAGATHASANDYINEDRTTFLNTLHYYVQQKMVEGGNDCSAMPSYLKEVINSKRAQSSTSQRIVGPSALAPQTVLWSNNTNTTMIL